MEYRKFGNTGIKISTLGFGAMRLPMVDKNGEKHVDDDVAIPIIQRAFELGVNYIDTAYFYCDGKSEYTVGKAIKGWRDKVYLSTKVPTPRVEKKSDYRKLLEEQLQKLDVDYIDFYHFHGLNRNCYKNTVLKLNLLEEAQKAKDEGLIKHISFSFHDKPEALMEMVDSGAFESVLCQYNLLDRSNEEAITYARSKGVGTAIMGPVGGGRLAAPSKVIQEMVGRKVKSTPEVALRFVLGNKDVCCALSGMNSIDMVEENARVASNSSEITEEEWKSITAAAEEMKELADLYCTGCNYCMPCPNGVDIPNSFRLMNYYKVYGIEEYARKKYANLSEDKRADNCSECGECEEKCPQNIDIRKQLEEVANTLG